MATQNSPRCRQISLCHRAQRVAADSNPMSSFTATRCRVNASRHSNPRCTAPGHCSHEAHYPSVLLNEGVTRADPIATVRLAVDAQTLLSEL